MTPKVVPLFTSLADQTWTRLSLFHCCHMRPCHVQLCAYTARQCSPSVKDAGMVMSITTTVWYSFTTMEQHETPSLGHNGSIAIHDFNLLARSLKQCWLYTCAWRAKKTKGGQQTCTCTTVLHPYMCIYWITIHACAAATITSTLGVKVLDTVANQQMEVAQFLSMIDRECDVSLQVYTLKVSSKCIELAVLPPVIH